MQQTSVLESIKHIAETSDTKIIPSITSSVPVPSAYSCSNVLIVLAIVAVTVAIVAAASLDNLWLGGLSYHIHSKLDIHPDGLYHTEWTMVSTDPAVGVEVS